MAKHNDEQKSFTARQERIGKNFIVVDKDHNMGDPIGSRNPYCDLPCFAGNCPQGLVGLSQAVPLSEVKPHTLNFSVSFDSRNSPSTPLTSAHFSCEQLQINAFPLF